MACRHNHICNFLALAVLLAFAQFAAADSPTVLSHYRFLPKVSVLSESGGIYPHTTDFRVFGTFDFTAGPGPTDVWPGNVAEFSNVNAWASHPILAYVLPLGRVFNLSGLAGRQLPVASLFDVYQFTGTAQDGSSVNLYASVLGPWLHLHGETTPPPGSADMFEYELRATAHVAPFADFNDDATVDAADLTSWSTNVGRSAAAGDANGDGIVDGSDLLSWQRQVGEAPPPAAAFDAVIDAAMAAQTANVGSVPEPNALGLAVMAMIAVASHRLYRQVEKRASACTRPPVRTCAKSRDWQILRALSAIRISSL
jgi:hypothetical protein